MSDPFIAEIVMFGGNFAPRSWAFCDGQLLAISQNTALFSLLGTTYGGDGRTTFGLPDMRGRVPIGPRNGPGLSNYNIGQNGGVETVALNTTQIPSHSHAMRGTQDAGDSSDPISRYPAAQNVGGRPVNSYNTTNLGDMGNTTSVGGSLAHENRQPFLAINFIIAMQGIFPSRN